MEHSPATCLDFLGTSAGCQFVLAECAKLLPPTERFLHEDITRLNLEIDGLLQWYYQHSEAVDNFIVQEITKRD
jgi:hypothetical protein